MFRVITEFALLLFLYGSGGLYLLKTASNKMYTILAQRAEKGFYSTNKLNQMLTCVTYGEGLKPIYYKGCKKIKRRN